MTTLTLERVLPAPLETAFDFVTKERHLLTWWGPEGLHVPEGKLDFTRTGPWYSVMKNAEGQTYKVSGEVTKVSPPNLVAFTWGWHDEADQRGHESRVTIELEAEGTDRTRMTLRHEGLADEESRDNHEMGWTSSLRKLEAAFA